MKMQRILILMLAQGLAFCGGASAAEYRREATGNLAPAMSYARFIERGMNFVLKDLDGGWAVGNAYKNPDGTPVPAYINYAIADSEHRLGVGHPVNAETVYPAFHHALYIRAFLAQWRQNKDAACLARARELGDWNLERRTPAEWLYGNMFYSTAVKGQVGGSVDGDAIMTDKPAIMALAMLELSAATGDARYRRAAELVAATLAKTQSPDGNWPFRVNPQSGEVREEYTSSAIYAVMLFEALDGKSGTHWRAAKAKTLKWILENPARTMMWRGFYEDIPSKYTNNRTNWDCIDTARWLVAHRADNPDYLPLALRLNNWIIQEFGDLNNAWFPAIGIREQKSCFFTMGVHTMHWAALQADLHAATGDAVYKSRALNACALVTHWMRPDNAIIVGPTWKDEIWFSCHLGAVLYMQEVMNRYPETVDANIVVVPAFTPPAQADPFEPRRLYTFEGLADNGASAPDSSSRKLPARLSGQDLGEGIVGQALWFKEGNGEIILGDLGVQAPATVALWLRRSTPQADMRILSQLGGPTSQAGCLRVTENTLQIWNGKAWLTAVNGVNDKGEWQHVALAVGEDGTVTGYLNGRRSATVRSGFAFNGVAAGLSAPFAGQYGEHFVGAMDDLRIYGRALSESEVAALYPEDLFARARNSEVVVPQLIDWKPLMTVAPVRRDAQGRLLPLQSYDETIRRGISFLLDDHLTWFKGPVASITDENGTVQMPWVYYSNLQQNGAPFPNSVDRFVSYPAFHHALFIRTFLGYWRYSKDERALKEAVRLADWNIAHSTPADWPYGGFPWSTFQEKKPGGFRDRSGLMPDKAAIMALAYLELHEATREARFLAAAQKIAEKLAARQRPDGTWPFRVDPRTEQVVEEYTSSVIYAVMLFERLDQAKGNARFKPHRDLTWNWLVNGPIRTKEFRGFYEDIPASTAGRTNYDCLDTIRYLLANRTTENGYLEKAVDLNAWIEKVFMDKIQGFEPAEGIREQLQCNVVMGIHSLNWAEMLLELAKATGDDSYRQRARQTANYVTYYLQPDNRIVVGFQYHQWWYSCHAGVILYLFDFARQEL